ncbi:MAG: efflux RND transporter periplasmic adaptor subunit [Patescibacteria group bacterium]|nr:efflux RND transporter periplasmic adaptor subunit [Patescibacteria group bacterium]
MSFFSSVSARIPKFLKSKWVIGGLVVLVAALWWFFGRGSSTNYQFISVTTGPITETVSVTGNTTPIESVSLAFGTTGTVAGIYAAVGDHVSEGQLLTELNLNDLGAQLQGAQANVDTQQAKLDGLQAGSRPEDIAAAQAAYDKSVQDLANYYANVSDTDAKAYASAVDAVQTQLSDLLAGADTTSPSLTFTTLNYQAEVNAENGRVTAGSILTSWQQGLGTLPSASNTDLDTALSTASQDLAIIRGFLDNMTTSVNSASNLSATTLATYKADVAAAISEVNTAITNVNTLSQSIASQKLTVAGLKAQLDLKKAGSTPQDIAAQAAQVESAKANVATIQAEIQNAKIVAPIAGTVTQFDAKVGQVAAAGTTLVSIISGGAFEVDSLVPETDIGKVAVGNPVSMTLDAFPGETFTGKVFYIDPAETITSGVVNYKVKVSFDKPDARLKSGLTANLDIETDHKDGVLILPQYAILQNDQGTFVEVLQGGKVVDVPVTLGLEDQQGNVEVVKGVTNGEQVLNIGLKQ